MILARPGGKVWTGIDGLTTVWGKRIGWVLLGWVLCSGYYGTYNLVRVKQEAKATISCEDWRANKLKALAEQDTLVDKSQIPKDCPHPSLSK